MTKNSDWLLYKVSRSLDRVSATFMNIDLFQLLGHKKPDKRKPLQLWLLNYCKDHTVSSFLSCKIVAIIDNHGYLPTDRELSLALTKHLH